ncbi:MAG: acyl-ACP--UDP-N-acetylglucosamine O-acyltransferase [Rikenellaceae bacterium]
MIDQLAYVHPDAKIGKDVKIEPFAYIAADVEIGDGTHIHSNAVLRDGARVGKNCVIYSGAVIAGEPQDLKFKGEYSVAIIGDGTKIRECATVNRGTAAKGQTVVGKNCMIMACAHIAHDCVIGNNVVIVNEVLLAGEVEVGDWAIIGGASAIHQFVRIGEHAMIGGGSLVSKDIPPYVKASHNPPSFVGANAIGLRRRNFSSEQIDKIYAIFRILFQSGLNYANACNEVEETIPQSPERDLIINFIRESKRGILKPYNHSMKNEE